jgi:hypothetical protein
MEIESLWKEMKLSFIEATSLSIFLSMKLVTHLFYEWLGLFKNFVDD